MKSFITIAFICLAFLSGCAEFDNSVSLNSTGQIATSKMATVVGVKRVSVNASNQSRMTGSAIGAVLGGLAGQSVRHYPERYIATSILGTVGGLVGQSVGSSVGHKAGCLYNLRLIPSGQIISLVEAQDDQAIRVGDTVRIVQFSGSARIYRE